MRLHVKSSVSNRPIKKETQNQKAIPKQKFYMSSMQFN